MSLRVREVSMRMAQTHIEYGGSTTAREFARMLANHLADQNRVLGEIAAKRAGIFERVRVANLYYYDTQHGYRKVVMKLKRKPKHVVARVACSTPLDQATMQELAIEALKRGRMLTMQEAGAHLLAITLRAQPRGLPGPASR